ncbi:hypothetical protein CUR178_04193 [Leishmania enriettii]|uniref:Fungal lipase-type domain-containing protein n=1 Tax=Leishmania enriettii TaxID=5663 RepID=A0A836KIH7_LEIEN|nr:hypothetical protein CUR178_04193 [Leishmania enriettii]
MPFPSLSAGSAAARSSASKFLIARGQRASSPHSAVGASGGGRRSERESAHQHQREQMSTARISDSGLAQKEQEGVNSFTGARGSRLSREERQSEEASRERLMQQAGKQGSRSATHRRRAIPTPPHRQLFVVDGYYGGEEWLDAKEYESLLAAHSANGGCGDRSTGVCDRKARVGALTPALANRAGSSDCTPCAVSFSGLPSASCGTQLSHNPSGMRVTPAGSPVHRPTAPSPTTGAVAPDVKGGLRKGERPVKLQGKLCFHEPVELQVESISAFAMRLTLVLWYACLIAALVVEVIPKVQWSMVNICGAAHGVDLRYMDKWTSPCVTLLLPAAAANGTLTAPKMASLRWDGADLAHLHSKMVRHRRLALSLPTPADQTRRVQEYNLVAETRVSGAGVEWVSEYPVLVRCDKTRRRCDVVRVPEMLLGNAPKFADGFSFTLTSAPESLAAGAAGGSVGIAYQRHAYTLATIVWRYVLMFLSLIHTLRFIAYCKYTSTLYEQSWTIFLQMALLWYMNPLFVLNITSWPLPSVLAFMEYRIPTYFMAVLIAYMLSVMTASMAWARPAEAKPTDGVFDKLKAFLARSRNMYDPPMWTKLLISAYMLGIFVLDIIDACMDRYMWNVVSGSEARFKRLYLLIVILHLAGGLVCLSLLFYLRDYLGRKSYLESRPQQLACRVFLMIFLSAIAYYVVHCLVFFLLYYRGHPALASQQPFLQLPMLMVTSFFVNIMTLVYTSQNRDESVPVHPNDRRWKHMVWPDTWYRWLARHGGSQYIFATEWEEMRFYRLQFEFRRRQFMARQKRLKNAGGVPASLVPSLAGSVGATTPSECANTMLPGSPPPMRDLPDGGLCTTSLLQRADGAGVLRGTNLGESLQASDHVSAVNIDAAAIGGCSQHRSELTDVWFNDCGITSPTRRDDPSVTSAEHGECPQSVELSRLGCFNSDSAAAAVTTFGVRNSDFCRRCCGVDSNGLTAVNVAARHIMNMDRFSTYFLADSDDMAGRDWGGVAEGRSDSMRDTSANRDVHPIEGPARRLSRMLQSASTVRGRDGEDGSIRVSEPAHLQASWGTSALTRTYSGCYCHEGGVSPSPAQLGLGSRCQHHARSLSAGDISTNSQGDGGAESSICNRKALPGHGTLPRAQRSRYQDPFACVSVSSSTGSSIAAASRPPRAAAATSADTFVLPQTDMEDEGECERWQRNQSELASRTRNGSFAHQHDDLQGSVLQLQASPAGGGGTDDNTSFEGASFADQKGSLALPRFPLMPAADRTSVSPASDIGEGDARQRWRRDGSGSRRRVGNADDDTLSSLSFHSSSGSDDDSRSDRTHGGARFFKRTLTLARERLGALMETAEQNLLERPVRGLDRLETHIFNAAYRPFQSIQYLPFFNLETAIDCFNISWEAYGVEESTGDQAIGTGIKVTPQNVPRTVAHGIRKVICGCCPAEDDSSDDGAEDDVESEAQREDPGRARGRAEGTAAVAPATGDDQPERMMHSTTTRRRRHSSEVIVHMRSERHQRSAAGEAGNWAAAPQQIFTPALAGKGPFVHLASPPSGLGSGAPAPMAAATSVSDPAVLPINVEKYGFVRLLVAEAREVQVLMVKMDTNASEHKGKAPRVIIGFRGTANMSNAKYDMNIHRVVWREMETAADREAANAAGEEASEMSSTFDDDITSTTQHLGCASCIRSCTRKTSWRPTCHAGFLAIWKTLRPTVLSRLRDLLCDDPGTVYRIFTTGHSLGGALASLCAYSITHMLKRMDYPIADVTVYTYGQPRMGNRTFQRIYNKTVPRSFRIVNESDVVVSVTMFGGYHVGIEVDVDRHGNFIVKPTEIEKLFPPTKGRGLALINHLMRNYGISLNAMASRTPCPARGLGCYLTADPESVTARKAKREAMHAVQP